MSKSATKELTIPSKQVNESVNITSQTVDVAQALKMRLKNKLTYQEIADHFGKTPSGIYRVLKPYLDMIQSPEVVQAYNENKIDMLSGIHMKLLSQLVNEKKLKDASLNNLAYTAKNVHEMLRLEKDQSTSNIAIALKFDVIEQDKDEGQEQDK